MLGFVLNFVSYALNENLSSVLIYGIANSLILALFVYYFSNIIIFQFAYFYYLCKYLRIKLKNLNTELDAIHKNKCFTRIHRILWFFDALYREIDEYNTTYWSKYLLIIWLFFGVYCLLTIYIIVFGVVRIFNIIIAIYGAILGCIMFNFLFTTASSLNYEANKTYAKLHSINLQYISTYKSRRNLRLMFKVNYY